MSFCFDSNPQIIHRYLDHLESMLMLWGSQSPARDDILNEQYFLSKLANLEDFWANIEVILECGSEEMKERARRLRCEVTIGCDNLITKRLEALDPLLDFMGKMTRRSVREVERERCEACKDEFGVSGMDARLTECGHIFHFNCIFKWLKSYPRCPVCRFRLSS